MLSNSKLLKVSPEDMKLLSTLLLCAAVLGGTAGLPSNNEYTGDALMAELQSTQEEEEFALREEIGDNDAAADEVGELFEGDIQGEDTLLYEPDSVEYTDKKESSDDKMFSEDAAGLSEDSKEASEDNELTSSDDRMQENYMEGPPGDDQDSPADDFDGPPNDDDFGNDKVTSTQEVFMFEGDILASREEILQTYDPDDVQNMMGITVNRDNVSLQATVKSSSRLWTERTVPYTFHSSLSASHCAMIRDAIDEWQRATCLRFVLRSTQMSYLHFRGGEDHCSSYVGRKGGEQSVFIGPRCSRGNAIHEIGHAVGFWHEQSRPDRDRYVNILTRNIKSGEEHNFMKRRLFEVDYHGTEYDYRSIMHYATTSFSKCIFRPSIYCPTIRVSNTAAYNAQGRPTLGQRSGLSFSDILQTRRLYNCPGGGVKGRLRVYIWYARNLPNTDPIFNKLDPYVRICAVNSRGRQLIKQTPRKSGTTKPTFNQWVEFSGDTWVSFEIRVWDKDSGTTGGDDPLTQLQTVLIKSGRSQTLKNCISAPCRGYLLFDYTLIPDGRECSTNPCHNGGTCIEHITAFTCRCPHGYRGQLCEFHNRSLHVFARFGRILPNKDGAFAGKSDPYIQFTARNSAGKTVVRSTSIKGGTHNPVWNQRINFPVDTWSSLKVQVFDRDPGRDDELTRAQTFCITPGQHRYICHCMRHCRGYIHFDYTF